jgi:hypothetical protein
MIDNAIKTSSVHLIGLLITYAIFWALGWPFTFQSAIAVFLWLTTAIIYKNWKLKSREKKSHEI